MVVDILDTIPANPGRPPPITAFAPALLGVARGITGKQLKLHMRIGEVSNAPQLHEIKIYPMLNVGEDRQ